MAQEFDPYYKWLGIPPKDQPPHHYRLLGIELFEDDRDVIDAAANRVMAYLKDLATGDEAEYSQNLLNEVSRARICLLNEKRKVPYDEELRGKLAAETGTDAKVLKPGAKPPVKKLAEPPDAKAPPARSAATEPVPSIRTVEQRPRPTAEAPVFTKPDESVQAGPGADVRWKLIAVVAAGAAGVCLVVLIGVVGYLFLGSGKAEVASGSYAMPSDDWPPTSDDANSEQGVETDPESSDTLVETDPEAETGADPETNPATDAPPDPESDVGPAPKSSDDNETEAEGPSVAKPDSSLAPGADMGLPTVPDTFKEPSPTDDATDNGLERPEEEPSEEVATASGTSKINKLKPLVDESDLAEMESPEPTMPEEETPALRKPKRKKAKPVLKPFQDLPLVVSLPELEAADAMSPRKIGLIHVPSGELCFIKLRGGDNACKGPHSFLMHNADGGLAERDWEVMLRDGAGGPETKIAHLSLDDRSQLSFQWQPAAKEHAVSAQLCNCAISLSCGGESHALVLREPVVAEGLTLEFEKQSSKDDWKIDLPPDPDGIGLEVVGVGDKKYTISPDPVMKADKGEAWLDFEDGGGLLSLRIETTMKRTLHITATPYIKSPADGQRQKLIARQLPQIIAQMVTQERQLAFNVQQGTQMAAQAPTARERALIEQKVLLADQAHTEIQTALEQLQELAKFLKAATGNIELRFRVYYDADSSQIDLLRAGS